MTTNHGVRRALLYGSAVPVLGVLLWLGFGYEADPDFGQALGIANTDLRLAASLPATDRSGAPLAARATLLADAEKNLAAARRQQPDSPVLREFEGYFHELKGDAHSAAACYRSARGLPDVAPEQFSVLVFSEVRVLAKAGDRVAALEVLEATASHIEPKWIPQCLLEKAELQRSLGRNHEASATLTRVLELDEPKAWVDAGRQWEALGNTTAAEAAFVRAAASVPIADVFLARLKLASGDVEKCWQLLECAVVAAPAETRRLLREESGAWQAIAAEARFQRLIGTESATPGR